MANIGSVPCCFQLLLVEGWNSTFQVLNSPLTPDTCLCAILVDGNAWRAGPLSRFVAEAELRCWYDERDHLQRQLRRQDPATFVRKNRCLLEEEAVANRLAGKHALVTGGSRGIGAAIVRQFAAEGARVLAADVREKQDEPWRES